MIKYLNVGILGCVWIGLGYVIGVFLIQSNKWIDREFSNPTQFMITLKIIQYLGLFSINV